MEEKNLAAEAAQEGFEIELTDKSIDMRDFYNYLTVAYKDKPQECPLVVIVKDLPEGREAFTLRDDKGIARVILVKEEVRRTVMTSRLYQEINDPQPADPFPADCSFYYTTEQIYDLYSMTLNVAELLKTRCPQLIYTCNMPIADAKAFSLLDQNGMANIIFLKEHESFTNTMAVYAAELRRAWQKEKHPKLYMADYTPLPDAPTPQDIHDYQMQKSEVDAEAFAMRYLSHMLDAVVRPNKDDPEVIKAIEERADKIILPI